MTLVVECYQPILVSLTVEVSVEASVTILFVSIDFSFDISLDLSFQIGSASPTPWSPDRPVRRVRNIEFGLPGSG